MNGITQGNAQDKVRVRTNFCTWAHNKKNPVLSKAGFSYMKTLMNLLNQSSTAHKDSDLIYSV